MSKNIIVVLMYHRHKLLDLIYGRLDLAIQPMEQIIRGEKQNSGSMSSAMCSSDSHPSLCTVPEQRGTCGLWTLRRGTDSLQISVDRKGSVHRGESYEDCRSGEGRSVAGAQAKVAPFLT
jgi:hypothetical protein